MSINTFTVDYYLEQSDWIAFSNYYNRTSKVNKTISNIAAFFPVALFLLSFFIFSFETILYAALFILLPFWLVQVGILKLLGNFITKKVVTEGHNRSVVGLKQITMNEDYIESKCSVSISRFYWSGIEKVEQNSDYIFIFVATNSAHIIPKRAFSNSEDALRFFNAAKTYHGKSIGLPAYCDAPSARLFEA